ncbi:MAG: hypothetical protein ACD_79C00053G0004 [uncultured bacterium]|nr:MAG: hypothetical protein ACD_79C00053G0004 [uncultured bacterium]
MLDLYEDKNQSLLPISENELSDSEVIGEIWTLKKELSDDIIILGHHYQQDDIIQFADVTGDSLQLARDIRKYESKKYIVFCGVHFMAETADMLCYRHQKVIIPDPEAGCFLADTAKEKDVVNAWDFFIHSTKEKIIPITYVNSSAALKAFVGKNGGAICTSSNAEKVITWALSKGDKLLFFPDQHLGRNTSYKLGIPLDKMKVYDPNLVSGGLSEIDVRKSKVLLWYGYCSVHQGFTAEQIDYIRKTEPDTVVIVHPECNFDCVQKSDFNGSTSYIIKHIEEAKPGTKFAVGTEINLVNRLAKKFPDKKIKSLSPYQCLCTTMYRIRPRWLLAALRAIKNNKPINVISVSEEIRKYSLLALEKMLEIV